MTSGLPDPQEIGSAHPGRGKALALLAGLTLLLELYLWWGKFQYSHLFYQSSTILLSSLAVLFSHWYFGDTLRCLGIRFDNWKQVLRGYGPPTVLLGALIVAAGAGFGEYRPATWIGAASYLGWAGVQQHLLQNVYRLRLQEVVSGVALLRRAPAGWASLLAAAVFAFLHWPNPILTGLTFVGGLLWCGIFSRIPSLWGATLSQTTLTLCLMVFFKFGPLNHFEVGAPGKRFEFYGEGVRLAAGYGPNREPVIGTLPGPDQGHPSTVRLFRPDGQLLREWVAFRDFDFSGELAIGDLTPDPGDEIAVTPGPGYGNPPLLAIFDFLGNRLREVRLPVLPGHYGAWVSIACHRVYVGAGPGPGSSQTLLELNGEGETLQEWTFDQLPFENGLRGTGICGDSDDLQPPEMILVWGSDISTNTSALFLVTRETFQARPIPTLGTTFGAQVSLLRRSGELPQVAVAPGPLHGHIGAIRIQELTGELIGNIIFDQDPARFGATLAAVDLDGDGQEELVAGEGTGPDRGFEVRLLGRDGTALGSFQAYSRRDFR